MFFGHLDGKCQKVQEVGEMKWSITKSVIAIVILLSTVSFGSPNLSGQYWFGSLSVDVNTNAPLGKRGTVSISGNQWDQEWDDNSGHHTFSSAFTTTDQPDGSINVNFTTTGGTYNVAWNGDVMLHANNDPDLNNRRGIDLIVRKASGLVHDDIVGEYGFFGHWLGWDSRWDEAGWGNAFFNGDGTGSEDITFDNGSNVSGSFDWMLDPTDPMIIVVGRQQPAMVGKGGVMFVTDSVLNNNFGLSFMVRKADQTVALSDIAGNYQVRFLETGPGGVPYTCGRGTCILGADGSFSVDAYYSNGEHDVFSTDYTVGPGNEFHLDDDSVPDGIISLDKNLIFIPEYRYENPPTRTANDWLGGIFLIRMPNIADLDGDVNYDIDMFTQYNGTHSFVDTFSDGLEPPAGPLGSSDYIVFGSFRPDRENGGLLELNTADGSSQDGDIELVLAVGDSSFFFNSGSAGYVSGAFEMNHGYFSNTFYGVGIDNYQTPKPGGGPDESIGAGIMIDADGSILALWTHNHHGISTDYSQDITSELTGHTKITLQVLLDSENRVTAKFDYGSDGSFDLVKPNYATLGYIAGTYTGTFQVDQWPMAVVSPISIQKCKAKAGKTAGKDSISFAGIMEDITADDLNGAGEIYITIVSDADDLVVYGNGNDPLTINQDKVKKGKYSHRDKAKGISFKIDTKRGKFALQVKNADLTGLGCPLIVKITIGDYNGEGTADESIVNGPKKPIPIQFMSGYMDTLPPPLKIKAKNGKKEFTDSLAVKGGFSLKDEPGPITSMTLSLGDQPFDLTDDAGTFTYKRDKKTSKIKSVAYKTKKGEIPQIKAKFDFVKCSYSVSIKKTELETTSGQTDLGMLIDMSLSDSDYNEIVKVDLD